jgi:hypothetical protein
MRSVSVTPMSFYCDQAAAPIAIRISTADGYFILQDPALPVNIVFKSPKSGINSWHICVIFRFMY